jgi:hypothetical protein
VKDTEGMFVYTDTDQNKNRVCSSCTMWSIWLSSNLRHMSAGILTRRHWGRENSQPRCLIISFEVRQEFSSFVLPLFSSSLDRWLLLINKARATGNTYVWVLVTVMRLRL